MTESEALKPKQRAAIAALLTGRSVAGAAEKCDISVRTLHTWLKQPAFLAALRQAEAAQLDTINRNLAAGSAQALSVLVDLMNNANPSVRLRAALGWLDEVHKWRQAVAIEDRLQALENALNFKN